MPTPPDFPDVATFTLQALPVDGYWPVAVRVRRLLKIALRRLRLKCVAIQFPEPPVSPDDGRQDKQ